MDLSNVKMMEGSIVRIKLVNFMTFSMCEFWPGPRMNLILAPNGSGKSSLVCAICLGLGGGPKHLGRADDLTEFVKRGATQGKVEIELYQAGRNLVVERMFSNQDNTSEWQLGGKAANQKAVIAKLKELHISVDNMCQLLPQDKVEDFSKFSEAELLRATLRVLRGDDFLDIQSKAQADQKTIISQEAKFVAKKAGLQELVEENKRNEGSVQRQKERLTMLEDVSTMEDKLAWAEFYAARDAGKQAQSQLAAAEAAAAAGSVTLEPLKAALELTGKQLERAKKEAEKLGGDQKKSNEAVQACQTTIVDLTEQLQSSKAEEDALVEERGKLERKIEAQRKKAEQTRAKLSAKRGKAYYDGEIKSLRAQFLPLDAEKTECETQVSALSATISKGNNRLTREFTTKLRSVEALLSEDKSAQNEERERAARDVIQHEIWDVPTKQRMIKIRSDPGAFAGRVLGPLICELRGSTAASSRALGVFVPRLAWNHMVTTTVRDFEAIGLTNIAITSDAVSAPPQRPSSYSTALFQRTGILGYLDEMTLGDPVAVEAARKLCRLHNCLVGSALTDKIYASSPEVFEELTPDREFRGGNITVVTPTRRIDISRSTYGNKEVSKKITSHDEKMPRIAVGPQQANSNAAEEEQAKDAARKRRAELVVQKQALEGDLVKTNEQLDEVKKRVAELASETKRLKQDIQELTAKRLDEEKLAGQIRTEEGRLAELEEEAAQDWEKKAEKHRATQDRIRQKMGEALGRVCDHLVEQVPSQLCGQNLFKSQLDAEKQLLGELLAAEETRVSSFSRRIEEITRRLSELRTKAKRAFELAKARKKHEDIDSVSWARFPEELEPLREELEAKRFQVNRIFADLQALARFEDNARKIKNIGTEVAELEQDLTDKRRALEIEVNGWCESATESISRIHDRVAKFFEKISIKGDFRCAAAVRLREDRVNLQNCGVAISVRFRDDTELVRLSPTTQSGGERALTTFLYLLALQDLSDVPFRVVDEINQGVDIDKERLAFQVLADVTTQGRAQHFLATPKLLPGLQYPTDVTVLFVFNGQANVTQKDWNSSRFALAQKKRIPNGEAEDEEAQGTQRSKRVRT